MSIILSPMINLRSSRILCQNCSRVSCVGRHKLLHSWFSPVMFLNEAGLLNCQEIYLLAAVDSVSTSLHCVTRTRLSGSATNWIYVI
jgi:hypothetical protein